MTSKRIYLDYAAATPVHPDVVKAMEKVLLEDYGNPSSLYEEGRTAKAHLKKSRELIAKSIGAQTDEIFFTSGGTEANFLSLSGLANALKEKGNHLITTAIEHSSILGTFKRLESNGFEVTYLPVEENGILDPQKFKEAIRNKTVLASVMTANNEIGTLEPIAELAEIAKSNRIVFHTDAIQAFPHFPIDLRNIDALTLSAQKIYGPKGIGAFYLRRGTPYHPVWIGGEQERKIRPGTENVPGIVGFAKAVEILLRVSEPNSKVDDGKLACQSDNLEFANERADRAEGAVLNEREQESNRLKKLRDRFIQDLTRTIECELNGDPIQRLPNNVNLTFKETDGESMLIHLDLQGIACSMGSACSAGALEPSHVLLALGRTPAEAKSSIRFTLGKTTTEEELEIVKKEISSFVEQLRTVKLRRW